MTEEILNTRSSSCPPDYFRIAIPPKHPFRKTGREEMPFIRSRYEKKSGKSSNNPRKQVFFLIEISYDLF